MLNTLTSPDTATRRTVLQKVRGRTLTVLPQLVNTGVQGLFHSPLGVLFTFPSQYSALSVTKEYLALRGGPRIFPQGSTCLVVLWILLRQLSLRLRGSHPLRPVFPGPFCWDRRITSAVRTPGCSHPGLGSSHFARRYSGNLCCFLFLRILRCFSSPGSLRTPIRSFASTFSARWLRFPQPGFPIQISADLSSCAAPRSFSQLITSFFGS